MDVKVIVIVKENKMNLTEFQKLNAQRAEKWHHGDLNQWSLLEWMGAMCGESGEAANVAKKIRRLELSLPNKEAGINRNNLNELKDKCAREIADSIIYGLIGLSVLEVDASNLIAIVFNEKSEEYGFPERAKP